MNCPTICVVCNSDLETTWHSLLTCPATKECWEQLGVWPFIDERLLYCENFRDMFFSLTVRLDQLQMQIVAMTLWSLWTKRNTLLWDYRRETNPEVIHRGKALVSMWELARNHKPTVEDHQTIQQPVKWSAPPPGWVKCNIDAAFDVNSSTTGLGLCLRPEGGLFMLARMDYKQPILSVMEGEASSLLLAL